MSLGRLKTRGVLARSRMESVERVYYTRMAVAMPAGRAGG